MVDGLPKWIYSMKFNLTLLLFSVGLYAAGQTKPVTSSAQTPLKLCGSVGFAQPMVFSVPGSYVGALEVKYILNERIDIGALAEVAQFTRSVHSAGTVYPTNSGLLSSYRLTGNYWLSADAQKRFRSFVGIGAGLYQIPAANRVTVVFGQSPDDILFPGGSRFGGMLRYGLKFRHYVGTVEYNLVSSSTLYRSATALNSPNSYLSVKIGYEIGGYKK